MRARKNVHEFGASLGYKESIGRGLGRRQTLNLYRIKTSFGVLLKAEEIQTSNRR